MTKQPEPQKPQIDKFKEAAREVETDDSEAAFDEKLKRVAKVAPPKKAGAA
jgi:hypothetical protein